MPVELPADRISNWPYEPGGPTCEACGDDAHVELMNTDHPGAQATATAPCPFCAKGYRLEFKISVKRNARGEVADAWYADPLGGPWGREGFWQGRDPAAFIVRDVPERFYEGEPRPRGKVKPKPQVGDLDSILNG